MKIIKKFALAVAGVATLVAPLGLSAVVHAQQVLACDTVETSCEQVVTSDLNCNEPGVEIFDPVAGCDLAIDKQVSVSGGAYTEADTSTDAAQAHVGDTVTWKIVIANASVSGKVPKGILTVSDVLPSGATFDSYTASVGTYSSGAWTFDVFGNLPATLTIVSHAASTGLFKNTATFSVLDWCYDDCIGVYSDSDSSNNSNDAWIDPSGKPAVLAASTTSGTTLANTGESAVVSSIAAVLIAATAVVVNFVNRKQAYKLNR